MKEKRFKDSATFRDFYSSYFSNPERLSRGDIDGSFLKDLPIEEKEEAKRLIRKNLKKRHWYIIEAVAILNDHEAVPELKKLLESETQLCNKLTISGVLWKLIGDPIFPTLIEEMASSNDTYVKSRHIKKIAWLENDRAISLLVEFLNDPDWSIRAEALSMLREIDLKTGCYEFLWDDPHLLPAEYYLSKKANPAFFERMTKNLIEWYNKNND